MRRRRSVVNENAKKVCSGTCSYGQPWLLWSVRLSIWSFVPIRRRIYIPDLNRICILFWCNYCRLNEPDEWTQHRTVIQMSIPPGTDCWRKTKTDGECLDTAPFYYLEVDAGENFEVRCKIKCANMNFMDDDQAGLMIRQNTAHWIKCGLQIIEEIPHMCATVNNIFHSRSTECFFVIYTIRFKFTHIVLFFILLVFLSFLFFLFKDHPWGVRYVDASITPHPGISVVECQKDSWRIRYVSILLLLLLLLLYLVVFGQIRSLVEF